MCLDLNWIVEFFAELETFSGKQWKECEDNPYQDFELFLEWCVSMVGRQKARARGYFKHAGQKRQIDVARFYGHLFHQIMCRVDSDVPSEKIR